MISESDRAFTSSEIVSTGTGLAQSTVGAVLRKLLAAGLVEMQGVTHSGKVDVSVPLSAKRRQWPACLKRMRSLLK